MNRQVIKNTVVTLDYNVTDPDGELVDAGEEPLVYLHGGYDDIFPTIEEALQGKRIGETVVIKMQPDEAFGEYDAELIEVEPREDFPEELQVGMMIEGVPEDGHEDDMLIYRVTEITDDRVVLDGNHPLAGMALIFTCTVTAVRPASAEEISRGYISRDDDDES
ncbi:MAG: peptidylprolyl isomerase [Candidatus Accumulibacter sp.]|jgi:FKBP-type peptidyl-prolyl cis-trans isomerase SlyD|nr:peptidylprolyl isomerase [Accumulibacter sp.]